LFHRERKGESQIPFSTLGKTEPPPSPLFLCKFCQLASDEIKEFLVTKHVNQQLNAANKGKKKIKEDTVDSIDAN